MLATRSPGLESDRRGAELLVAEGAEAAGRIGDVVHLLPALLAEVRAHSSLLVIAAGGVVRPAPAITRSLSRNTYACAVPSNSRQQGVQVERLWKENCRTFDRGVTKRSVNNDGYGCEFLIVALRF
jgi:hypothetical protein